MRGQMTRSVYDIIKKQNGEAFAKAIRNYDSGIFEIPNLPHIVRYAGRNALPLLPFLESLKGIKIENITTYISPFELLSLAGYDAYYADTFEKQNAIQKYFKKSEELCTFDEERYKNYYIINAVKKNVDEIERKDFYGKEQRQDAYGTSVISIQILKKGGFISIKNRYNHTVQGCDNTFNSNPDNIIKGLSFAIKKYFNVDFSSQKVPLSAGYTYQKNQIFKYEVECNNVYYGEDFYLKDGVVYPLNKDCQMMAIPFIFDLKKREVLSPSRIAHHCFLDEIKEGTLQVIKQAGEKVLTCNGQPVVVTKNGQIKKLCLLKTKELDVGLFSEPFHMLETIEAPLLKTLGAGCFNGLKNLKKASFPVLENLSKDTFTKTSGEIFAPKLAEKGIIFFASLGIDVLNKQVKTRGMYHSEFISFLNESMLNRQVNVQTNDDGTQRFLVENKELLKFRQGKLISFTVPERKDLPGNLIYDLPDLEEVNFASVFGYYVEGKNFNNCPKLKKVSLPNVTKIGSDVFCDCDLLEEIDCPKVRYLGWDCVKNNPCLKRVFMPELKETKDRCFKHNGYEVLSLPNLDEVKSYCFCHEPKLKVLDLPFLQRTEQCCFCFLDEIEEINLPSLKHYPEPVCFLFGSGEYFSNNKKLKKVRLNELTAIQVRTFRNCPNLKLIVLDKAGVILEDSLCNLPALEFVIAPEIDFIYENVLSNCEKLKYVYMPQLRLIKRDNFYNTPLLSVLYAPNAAFVKEENLEKKPTVVVQKKLPSSMEKYIQQFEFER